MPVGVPRATTRRGGPRNATARPRFPRRPRLDAPSASAETSQSAPSSASSATASDARDDLPVRVYIEHTDAYQVVYHSNYFKFLWRAREAYVFGGGLASALRDRTGAPFDPTAAGWDHLDVVAIDDCVFARSAVLGDDLLVRINLKVCADCHSFLAHAAGLLGRTIHVLGPRRKHVFRQGGRCSCEECQ